jgi:DNA repair exonuclease SbcCD ATPase subunit
MAKHDPSALVAAATTFDAELATYARLGDLFLKSPLDTLKRLERANATLDELAQSEQRLAQCGQQLIAALGVARDKQEQLSKAIVAHAPALEQRNTQLRELMTAMQAVATDVAAINQTIVEQAEPRPDPGEVSAKVMALSARAEQVAADARAADLAEIAEQAHALHQRLQALASKLAKAAPS